ncbi:hypothetical protein Pmani_036500 [Petrolisthes manimaculis]|uniref:Small-subunit processome Utp12 domain-containing protein n=1 Tax=Petrolisthes manimaculis TaxID=1843537 RepID=A0AAE1NID4_9EUCA|nr:hypothetical protein Pmani_036500 [Petrolisthes manimaculis]
MKFAYKFSNLLGTVYRKGTVIFSKDGNTVLCPVGNKISMYDLRNNRSCTLPVESQYNFTALALAPNGNLLIAADEVGEVRIISMMSRSVLYSKRFPSKDIKSIKFSPDGKHFAITKQDAVLVYTCPGSSNRIFNPFHLMRVFQGAYDVTTCIDWSYDGKLVAIGSQDMSTRVYSFVKMKNLKEYIISGSRDTIIGAFFEEKSYNLYTVAKDGRVTAWDCNVTSEDLVLVENPYETNSKSKAKENEEKEEDDIPLTLEEELEKTPKVSQKAEDDASIIKLYYERRFHVFMDKYLNIKNVCVSAAQYHTTLGMMVVAFTTGDFVLLDMNDKAALIHSLNISKQTVSSVAMNPSGDWIALGVSSLGQLMVWEWQSESYILKQQGHFNNIRVVTYSPDGQNLVTGGEDGKVKVWSTQSSFCFVTFTEHTSAITGLVFTQSGRAILSSSLDGTVRAFDMSRYRNFKTLTSPRPTQFSCLTVDCSGELVAAGGQDAHNIYLWSLKTGRLLEVLGGHEGPVVSLQFSPVPGSTLLASTSWDGTLKVWDAIANTTAKETISISSDGLCLSIRPDGKQIAVATIDGQITMFNPTTGQQEGNIMGQEDLGTGRADADKITALKSQKSKAFTSICYSSDGMCLLAGGQGKNVCIYSVADELLIKKFQVTQNKSFDAMDDTINRRKLAENDVNLALVEDRDDSEGVNTSVKLPGTRTGDKSLRAFRPEVRVSSLTFSPTGRCWASSTSEGLLIYSLDTTWLFDPLDLDISNTPSAIKQKLNKMEYSTALMMAVRLNIDYLKRQVIEAIPVDSVSVVAGDLVQLYVEKVLSFLGEELEKTPHLGLYAYWAQTLVTRHGHGLKERSPHITSSLNALQKALTTHNTNLSKVCSHNEFMLSYLLTQASLKQKRKVQKVMKETSGGASSKTNDDNEKNKNIDDEDDDDDDGNEAERMEVLFSEDAES